VLEVDVRGPEAQHLVQSGPGIADQEEDEEDALPGASGVFAKGASPMNGKPFRASPSGPCRDTGRRSG